MALFRTGNPILSDKTFTSVERTAGEANVMTIQGTVNKTALLGLLLLISALWTWNLFYAGSGAVGLLTGVGVFGGLAAALVTIFKKNWSAVTAPIYALLEGMAIGGISAFFETQFPGIVIQAVALTFGVLVGLLMAYRSRLIKATENFKLGVASATGAIFLIYMMSFVLGMFGTSVPFIHESGIIGIGFSLFVVVIAALNLVLDFDFIEQGAAAEAPKYMEWFAAFALMVTLIWLYIEILRLLAKLRSR